MEPDLTVRARIEAPIAAVRAALTDGAALRHWLAEHAEVDLAAERYEFWGRHTPDGRQPRQRLLAAEPDRLRLSWPVLGADTTVEFRLAARPDGGTDLGVHQDHTAEAAELAGYPGGLALMVFWSLAVGNLVDHLLGREPTPRCDYTAADLRAGLPIGASPAAVYDSFVDPAQFRQWFGLGIEIEPHAGGRWSLGPGGPVGTVLACTPGRLLRLGEESGVSTWEFDPDPAGTRLTVGYANPDGEPPYPGWTGWLSGISQLRRFHELGARQPIWLAP
jgi:uncharacterized protein YndB with AHSA1/START domain